MIHWEYIKGLNQKTTGQNTESIYTFLNFQNATKKTQDNSEYYDFDHSPTVIVSSENQKTSGNNVVITDFGHIITQSAVNQFIDKDFKFKSHLSFEDTNSNNKLNIYQNYIYRTTNNGNYVDYIEFNNDFININTTQLKVPSTLEGNIINGHKVHIESDANNDGSCTAVYFNATSDRRAKTDFSLLDIDALKLVKKVQLYSFKYKDSNLPSIGIIAQDVQDIDINGFKLVDNENATGQNFDYMTIHESKLTYILWKAVQELSKEVEDLKKQLNK